MSPSNLKLKKALADHKKIIKELNGKQVEAGWFESDVYSSGPSEGISIAQVARWNEFGTATIPARPFRRYAMVLIDKERAEINASAVKKMVFGKLSPEKALGFIGNIMVGKIRESIQGGPWVDNAESTKAKKGHGQNNRPLIDTGHMYQNVQFKVT